MDEVFPMVSTSVNKTEILQLLPTLIGYSINETTGFPTNYKFANISGRGSLIVPTDLDTNVAELHKFLYGDEAYTPSSTVKTNSERILRSSAAPIILTLYRLRRQKMLTIIQQYSSERRKRLDRYHRPDCGQYGRYRI